MHAPALVGTVASPALRRRAILPVVALVLALAGAQPAAAADTDAGTAQPPRAGTGVAWAHGSFASLLARAASEHKPLMVDVFATWCGPCQMLDKNVYSRVDVADEAASHYIAARIDAEKGEGPAVAKRYHVVGYPTVLFLDPSGQEIDRVFGYEPPADFLKAMVDYRQHKGTLDVLAKEALEKPLDLDLAYEVGFRYAVRGNADEAERHFARIFAARRMLSGSPSAGLKGAADVARLGDAGDFARLRPLARTDMRKAGDHVDALLAKVYLALGKYLYLRGEKDYNAAVRVLTELARRFPDSPEAKEVPFQLAIAYWKQGRPEKTKAKLQGYLTAAHMDSDAVNAVAWFCFEEKALMDWGRELAETAVKKDPKNAALLDTLAELRNAHGDPAGAADAERAAMKVDPKDPYYREQLERFTTASKGASEAAPAPTGTGG